MIATLKIIHEFFDCIVNDKHLVVAVGYTNLNEFGYFVCWKDAHDIEPVIFLKKENEDTYQNILKEAKKLIELHKNNVS